MILKTTFHRNHDHNMVQSVFTPTLRECVREDLDCVCGVHGYKLFAEFDYVCESCGNSEYAEFRASPKKQGCVRTLKEIKQIRPSLVRSIFEDDDDEVFVPIPSHIKVAYGAPLRNKVFRRRIRAKSAPPFL